jgi:O-antigen/teichoic acid export membrane protein
MAAENIKERTVSSVGWKFTGSIASYGITFVVGLILARVLGPEEYGLVGIIMIFITIFNGIVDSGLSNALIRKTDSTEVDYSTTFIANLVVSAVLYTLLFLGAPLVASFFRQPALVSLMRVMGVLIFIQALMLIQQTVLTKELDFKTQAKCSIISSIISGVVGVGMAFTGFGVWSIVGQQISKSLSYTVAIWIYRNWWPRMVFSWKSFRELWDFGWKILVSGLISNLWSQMSKVVIGRVYSSESLGYYEKAREYVAMVSQNLTMVVQSVSYPALSQLQDEKERLKQGYRKVIKVTMLVTFVLVIGLAACAKQFILVLIGEKWLMSVPMMQIICFSYMLFPLHAINLNILQVQGRSDLFLKLEIIKKIIAVIPILIGVFCGLYWMLIGNVVSGFFSYYLNAYYSGPFLGYSIKDQVKDILPSFTIAMTMGVIVYGMSFIPINYFYLLPIQIIVGGVIVVGLCKITKLEEYEECKAMMTVYVSKIKHIR